MKPEISEFVKSAATLADCPPPDRPEIALSGRSNVGKSSLLNRLLGGRGLARTSRTPGKTRLLNYFAVDGTLYLVDLPGYGFARVNRGEQDRWRRMVDAYLRGRETLRGAVQLVDARHPPSEGDRAMAAWFEQVRLPFVVALTKADKLKNRERRPHLDRAREALAGETAPRMLYFSARNGEGARELWRWIEETARKPRPEGDTARSPEPEGPRGTGDSGERGNEKGGPT
jgi:GTP-binding protein